MSSRNGSLAALPSVEADYAFLQKIVERLLDGIVLVTTEGDWVYGNDSAERICQQLDREKIALGKVPPQIWQVCQFFLTDHSSSDRLTTVESDIYLGQKTHYRVRVRWFTAEKTPYPYLLVTLEDCYQVTLNRVFSEMQQYQLTERQSEVWLLFRTGHSYREIATKLFVTLNTVKRHMKNIYAKQKTICS